MKSVQLISAVKSIASLARASGVAAQQSKRVYMKIATGVVKGDIAIRNLSAASSHISCQVKWIIIVEQVYS